MFWSYLLPMVAALFAGGMNAVAGGGSFLTFPALVFTGVPPIIANASSTVALFPSAFASAWAYREDFRNFEAVSFRAMLAVSVIGGVIGALLLLFTPQRAFDAIIPWLLLVATLAFTFGPSLSPMVQRTVGFSPRALLAAQFLVGLYGGYFGGAIGLIMLALWSLFGLTDIKMMNANKTLLGGSLNAAAVVCFVIAGKIWWGRTMLMLAAAALGGYASARLSRRINPSHVRAVVIVISMGVTLAFFLRRH